MARLEKINNTSWKQPFRDRKKEFHLWGSHTSVAGYCNLTDGTKRLLQIQFESKHHIDIIDRFQITSGKEISFPKEFQNLIKPIVLENPNSHFIVKVLDIELEENEEEPFSTTGLATINTRIGQSRFRQKLIDYWKGCAVTGIQLTEVLKASHIKPWSESSNSERLDMYNGILLNSMLDSLFDCGLITFSDTGGMILSSKISDCHSSLGLDGEQKLSCIDEGHKKYLEYHRENVFKS